MKPILKTEDKNKQLEMLINKSKNLDLEFKKIENIPFKKF